MPGGNFDGELNVRADGIVDAGGPLDPNVETAVEMCVWVFQRDGDDDATANAMAMPNMGTAGTPRILHIPDGGGRWDFPLPPLGEEVDFHEGSATAFAIGLFKLKGTHGQRVFLWSEPVRLTGPGAKPCEPTRVA